MANKRELMNRLLKTKTMLFGPHSDSKDIDKLLLHDFDDNYYGDYAITIGDDLNITIESIWTDTSRDDREVLMVHVNDVCFEGDIEFWSLSMSNQMRIVRMLEEHFLKLHLDEESNGFLDCISAFEWEVSGDHGQLRIIFGDVYDYSLKKWKDAYDELCEQKQRHCTYLEYYEWMKSFCLNTDIPADEALEAYRKYQADKQAEEQRAAIVRNNQAAFENACDYLYYGMGFKSWFKALNGVLSEDDAKIVWKAAFDRVANMD